MLLNKICSPRKCMFSSVIQLLQRRIQLCADGNLQVVQRCIHTLLSKFRGLCHGGIGSRCSSGAVLHRCQDPVKILSSAIENGKSAHASLCRAPEFVERSGIPIYAITQNGKDIAKRSTSCHESGKGLSCSVLEDAGYFRAGISKLIQYGLQVSTCLCRCHTICGEDRIRCPQVVHLHTVSSSKGDDLADRTCKFVHSGFTQILSGDEDVRNPLRFCNGQAIGIEGCGEDIHGSFRLSKTARCQAGRFTYKFNCRSCVHTGRDGRIGCLCNGFSRAASLPRQGDNLRLNLLQ